MLKHKDILDKMTLEEKAALCDGADFWHLKSIERLGLSQIMVCDGPHGLRKQDAEHKNGIGLGNSVPATCFPTACTTACSWDPDLLREMGAALGERCLAENVSVLLGPGANMKRSPLCGRNFEYFSEDPVLAGEMAAAWIEGVQSKGVGASLKHFAANSQETRRMTVSSVVDERALREIYLTAFEKAVKKARPWTVMNAYNRLNGTYCSENAWLETQVLRREWGFDGVVVSDWGAVNDRVAGLKAGNDLEMPSSAGVNSKRITDAILSGALSEDVLNTAVDRLIDLILRANANKKADCTADNAAQHKLARKIAGQSMVLLKNEENILPLRKDARIAVIGEMAKKPRYQGAGSSLINPIHVDNALNSLREAGYDVLYARGYNAGGAADPELLHEAHLTASRADIAVVFVGLTDDFESEGFDRAHMSIPRAHNTLVRVVSEANPNTVVVLAGGAPVTIPWVENVKGILNSYLGGEAGAAAVADILCGAVNPSGKLAETYPVCEHSVPCIENFPGNPATVEYRESIYIGYRYYEKAQKKVRFPFGFGLSYTQFRYSDLQFDRKEFADNERLTLSFRIKNTGDLDGAEIAQIYVADPESTVFRPVKELKAFKKVFLKAGEEKRITMTLGKRAFAYYNTLIHDWHVESGNFEILVGASSADIRLRETVYIRSTNPDAPIPDYRETAPAYYTADVQHVPAEQFEAVLGCKLPDPNRTEARVGIGSSLEDAQNTKWGGRINKVIGAVTKVVDKSNTGMAAAVATQTPIRNFVSMSGGLFSEDMADGFLQILNDDKPLEGVGKIAKGVPNAVKNLGAFLKSI